MTPSPESSPQFDTEDLDSNNSEEVNPEISKQQDIIDQDRLLDITEARIDQYQSIINLAREQGVKEQKAESNWDKFDGISKILRSYSSEGLSHKEYQVLLLKKLLETEQREKNSNKQQKDILLIRHTLDFLSLDKASPNINDKLLDEYKEQEEQKRKITIQNQENQELKNTRAVLNTEVESTPDGEIIKKVLEKSGIVMHTSLCPKKEGSNKGLSGIKNGGFQDLGDGKLLIHKEARQYPGFDHLIGVNSPGSRLERGDKSSRALSDMNISEMVHFSPVTKPEYKEQQTKVEKKVGGILGFGAKIIQETKIEQKHIGNRPVSSKEIIEGGDDKPCIEMSYMTTPSSFRDYTGREGQVTYVTAYMPEYVARELHDKIKQRPELIHELIDQVAIQDMNIPENMWRNGEGNEGYPLRPPFEEWQDEKGKSKIYISDEREMKKTTPLGNPEFDEDFIVEY